MLIGKRAKTGITDVTFRHWSRKKYAAFNSLRRIVKICTLCIAYNIIVMPAEAFAQTNGDSLKIESYNIDDVIVKAGQTPIEEQQLIRNITIINKTEIDRAPVQSVNDLLRYIAGVDIRQRGPLGVQADISLRGGTFDQTLILLNGINITDPQTGHHNLNLPVDIESIEQIEVLQGPSAKSFGVNAFNGVINIITGNSKPNHISTSVLYGQYGLYKASANISNTIGNFSHFISFNGMGSDGYIKNTDFTNSKVFYQAGLRTSIGKIDFQTGYNRKDFAANSFYSLKYPNQFEAIKTEFVSLKYESNTRIKISSAIYLRRQRDRFELRRDTLPYNHHLTNTAGIDLKAVSLHRFGSTSLGIDLRNEHIISNILGIPLNNPIVVYGFKDVYYTNYYNRLITSINADQYIKINKFSILAGVMAYNNSRVAGFRIYPGIDISYGFNDLIKIYSSVNKTLRTPTFTDLFYKSPSQKGNRDLVPEEALTVESGFKYYSPTLTGNLSLFRRWGYRMIDWVKYPSPDSLVWRSLNHSRINFSGMEISILYNHLAGNIERVQSMSISYSYLHADWNFNNMLSKYALDFLKNRISTNVDIWIKWKLFISNRLTYNDRKGSYQDNRGNIVTYKPFWLDDIKIYWKSDKYTIFTEASNVFNARYFDFGGVVQPGIWLRCGVAVELNYVGWHRRT
jgi:vitamin B12 transporter